MRLARRLLLAVLLLAAAGAVRPAAAQIDRDSLRADSLRADSLRADSLRRRQATQTARYLEESGKLGVVIAAPPRLGPDVPVPAGGRLVLTRDSIDWAFAETVGDLLQRVPGVYLWRAGWTGALEQPNYRSRGPSSVEWYLDGLPYLPLGADSVAVDATGIGLFTLDRVEIETWPGRLAVYLYTRRHERLAARSQIGIAQGDGDFARYQGALEKRADRGVSFGVAADYLNTGPQATLGSNADFYRNSAVWAQLGWTQSPTFMLQAQLVRAGPRRIEDAVGGLLGQDGKRTETQLRAVIRSRADGFGSSLDLVAGRSSWRGQEITQAVWHAGAVARLRTPTVGLGLSAFHRSRWTPLDAQATLGWTPGRGLAAQLEGVARVHDEGRRSLWASGRLSLGVSGPLRLVGAGRIGQVVAAPALDTSQAQDVREVEGALQVALRWMSLEGGLTQTNAFAQPAYPSYTFAGRLAPMPATTWLTLKGSLRPFDWMDLHGSYSTPLSDFAREGQPSEHFKFLGSIRSRFLRRFRSGAFELKGEFGVERWGASIFARDEFGDALVLPQALYLRGGVQLRLQSFIVYFERRNGTGELVPYVPNAPAIPNLATNFGVRWEFTN